MDQDDKAPWEYKPNGDIAVAEAPLPKSSSRGSGAKKPPSGSGTITWTASEYIEHSRGISWYGLLVLATIVLAGGIYLLTHEYFSTGVIVIVGIVVAVFATHKPQKLQYELSTSGLQVGGKAYNYGLFKSFSVIKDGGLNCIVLEPLKRFMLPLSIYYSAADEEKIMDILGTYLPYEEKGLDPVDRLTRRLRF